MSEKPLIEYELALQEFVMYGFNRTKLASMIYSVSISKGEGLGYNNIIF